MSTSEPMIEEPQDIGARVLLYNRVSSVELHRVDDADWPWRDDQGGGWYWEHMLTLGKIQLLAKED